jgi:hypothetical protein
VTPRELKTVAILAGIVVSALLLLAWTQQWFSISLSGGILLDVRGDIAAPAQLTLALCGLLLFASLTIAGPFFRVVLGLLATALGALVVFASVFARVDPIQASKAAITEATGVGGVESTPTLVELVTESPWPIVSIFAGVALAMIGLFVAATGRIWPSSSRKYQAVRVANEDGSSVGDWDALSEGDDPTAR